MVTGHIAFETVTSFFSDFHHEDREDVDVEAMFLHPDEPELEFKEGKPKIEIVVPARE